MTSDDQWPFANRGRLLRALAELAEREEQQVSAEALELAETVARLAAWQAPAPSSAQTRLLLERLEPLLPAPPQPAPAPAGRAGRASRASRVGALSAQISWLWLLAARQVRVIPWALWLGSALALICLTLFGIAAGFERGASALLLLAPLIAATGAAFVYSRETDPSLELALATPTSVRLILLARVALALGFDVLLTLGGSALVAITHGQSVGYLLALWLAPTLLLSSATLCLSLLAGPLVAVASAIAVWGAQAVAVTASFSLAVTLSLTRSATWLASPLALVLAGVFLVIALLWAPYQRRLA